MEIQTQGEDGEVEGWRCGAMMPARLPLNQQPQDRCDQRPRQADLPTDSGRHGGAGHVRGIGRGTHTSIQTYIGMPMRKERDAERDREGDIERRGTHMEIQRDGSFGYMHMRR
eukprot:9497649-Pyramimonas_sp.AAC.4